MKQLIRRFLVLGTSSLFTQVIAFGALAVAARRVTPADLGSYTVALSIVTFISLPSSMGITIVGTRDVAQNPDRVRQITGEVFLLQLIVAVVGYAVILALSPVISPNHAMQELLPIVGLFLFTGMSFEWTLQALGEMRAIAVARVIGQVVYGALVPLLVVHGLAGMKIYAWLMIGGLALKLLLTAVFLVRTAGPPDLRVGWAALRRRWRGSLTMGYSSVMLQLYGTIDQVMLGYFSTAYDAGEYAAAYRIPNALGTFTASWLAVVFPHSAAMATGDPERLRSHSSRLLTVVALFVVPLVACTPFVAHDLLVASFGSQYGPASTAFTLLIVSTGLGIVDGTMGTWLMGLGRDRMFARLVTITALLNVAINLIVIPIFGRNGAAVDTIVSEVLGFLIAIRGVNAALGGLRPEWGRLGRIVLSVGPAVLALIVVPDSIAVWIRIPMGAAVYSVALVVFGAVATGEIRAALGRGKRPAAEPITSA